MFCVRGVKLALCSGPDLAWGRSAGHSFDGGSGVSTDGLGSCRVTKVCIGAALSHQLATDGHVLWGPRAPDSEAGHGQP